MSGIVTGASKSRGKENQGRPKSQRSGANVKVVGVERRNYPRTDISVSIQIVTLRGTYH